MHGELPGAASAFLSVASRVEVAAFFRYLREDVSQVDDDDLQAVFQLAFRQASAAVAEMQKVQRQLQLQMQQLAAESAAQRNENYNLAEANRRQQSSDKESPASAVSPIRH